MARNEEKAMAMLNRWVKMKREINQKPVKDRRRPHNIQDVQNVADCDHWRNHVVREIIKKVSQIQNASLGEYRIRDLNDQINDLLKEKLKWEHRLRELGGPDYADNKEQKDDDQMQQIDGDGISFPGDTGGYKYFGAAKNLPKVREIFQKEKPLPPQESRDALYKKVTFSYLGFETGEDMNELEDLEAKAEARLREQQKDSLQEGYLAKKRRRMELQLSGGTQKEEQDQVKPVKISISDYKNLYSNNHLSNLKQQQQSRSGKTEEEKYEALTSDGGLLLKQRSSTGPNASLVQRQTLSSTKPEDQVQVTTTDELFALLNQKKKQLLMQKYASQELQEDQINQ